jgi:hypothetical protein
VFSISGVVKVLFGIRELTEGLHSLGITHHSAALGARGLAHGLVHAERIRGDISGALIAAVQIEQTGLRPERQCFEWVHENVLAVVFKGHARWFVRGGLVELESVADTDHI